MADVKIVDISGLWSDDTKSADAAIWEALQTTGSMVIANYPNADKIDDWARTGLSIHDLDEQSKRDLTIAIYEPKNKNVYRGYHPIQPGSYFKVNLYDVGPQNPSRGPDLPGMDYMTEPNVWPSNDTMPQWRKTVEFCYTQLNELAQKIMLSIGRSAGFDESTIMDRFAGEHSTLRFLDYPNQITPDDGLSAGCHEDASGLSLLWQGEPGLQAKAPDGTFYDIPQVENCISIHVGTVMKELTNGVVPATPHQVLASDGPRRSMGFFLEPALSAPVTPAHIDVKDTSIRDTYGYLVLKTHHSREKYANTILDPEDAL